MIYKIKYQAGTYFLYHRGPIPMPWETSQPVQAPIAFYTTEVQFRCSSIIAEKCQENSFLYHRGPIPIRQTFCKGLRALPFLYHRGPIPIRTPYTDDQPDYSFLYHRGPIPINSCFAASSTALLCCFLYHRGPIPIRPLVATLSAWDPFYTTEVQFRFAHCVNVQHWLLAFYTTEVQFR